MAQADVLEEAHLLGPQVLDMRRPCAGGRAVVELLPVRQYERGEERRRDEAGDVDVH